MRVYNTFVVDNDGGELERERDVKDNKAPYTQCVEDSGAEKYFFLLCY